MTVTIATFVGNGSQTDFAFSFDYLRKEFVKVLVDGTNTSYTFHTTQTVRVTPAPAAGKVVIVKRVTDRDRLVQFVDGSILVANDLNVSALQAIHIAAEALDAAGSSLITDQSGAYSAGFRRIADVGDPTLARDVVNKQWAETAMTSQLTQATAAKNAAVVAQTAAEVSEDAALVSKTAAASSAAAALSNKNLTDTAKAAAETAKVAAEAAEVAAEAARDLALSYRNTTQTYRDEVVGTGATPMGRLITAGGGLLGGGDLSANRTLSANFASVTLAREGDSLTHVMSPALVRSLSGTLTPAGSGGLELTWSGIPEETTEIALCIALTMSASTQHVYVRPNGQGSGYTSSAISIIGTATPVTVGDNDTTGFIIYGKSMSAIMGLMTLRRATPTGNVWYSSHTARRSADSVLTGTGVVTLSGGPMTSLRIRCGGLIVTGGSCTLNWRI